MSAERIASIIALYPAEKLRIDLKLCLTEGIRGGFLTTNLKIIELWSPKTPNPRAYESETTL
jgi:hypothetical protein